jgi:ankyrin repeat protein
MPIAGRIVLLVFALLSSVPLWADDADKSVENEFLLNGVIRGKDADVFEELKHGADPDTRDAGGRPVVFLATVAGHTEVVLALLNAGAKAFNETHQVGDGKIVSTPLAVATWTGKAEIAGALVAKGADFKQNGQDAWRGVAVCGQAALVQALLAAGADPNYRFADGESALTIAAMRGHTEVLEQLLDHAGKANFRSNGGVTPLMLAAAHGYEDEVRLLLERGAYTWPVDTDGWDAYVAVSKDNDPASRARIAALLEAHGSAGLNPARNRAIDEQLLLASYSGDLEQVKSLLAKGAAIEVRGVPNSKLWLRDALSAAVAHPQVCRYLIGQGINVHMMDGGGYTAMHTAASQGSAECIKAMAEAGLDVNIKSHGKTALARAIDFKRPPEIIAALRAAGGQE